MKREKNSKILGRFLDRHFSPSNEQIESARARVLPRIQAGCGDAPESRESYSGRKMAWPVFVAAAAVLLAAISISLWYGKAPAVLQAENEVRRIHFGEIARAGDAGGMLTLADGSRVEMKAQSELSLERADDGVRIRLNKGSVIVNAAKQHGHLYVQTKDVTVSVVGTVFLVNAEAEGSRVAVIQGEVRVQQQGETETKLQPGDQIMTKPLMEWRPVSEEFSWSHAAPTHLALLQQSVVPPAEPQEAFEVVAVRRSPVSAPVGGGPRGRGGGVLERNPRTPGHPCSSGDEPVVDPRRFDAVNMTLHALVAWAYGLDCEMFSSGSDFLFGGAGWTKDDGFDIQALIPEGTPSYTANQFRAHGAPKLQKMLQSMLADRFNLVVHREMKEMQVYVLTVAKGGPKFITSRVNPNAESPAGVGFPVMLNSGLQSWKEGDNSCCHFNIDGRIWAQKESMANLAWELEARLGQPVLDRTGLTGEFNYMLSYQPRNPPNPDRPDLGAMIERDFGFHFPPQGTHSIFAALEQAFGLHLESTKEKLEVLVIDRVEKPSDN